MRLVSISVIILQILTLPLLAQQPPDRATIRRDLESRFPVTVEPAAPVVPRTPGLAGPAFVGALLGAGAFVGSATLCGKAQFVGPSPYGADYNGRQVAPGEIVNVPPSVACSVGIAAGTAVVSGWFANRDLRRRHVRELARYEQTHATYVVSRGRWEQQLAIRNRALDSAVNQAFASEQLAYDSALAEAAAARAAAEVEAELARAAARATREVPLVAPVTALRNPSAVAVVIGNQNYRGEVPPVDYAARDAVMMRRFLVQTFGFQEENIIFEQDASFTTLTRIFGSAIDPRGQLHGYVQPDGSSDVFIFYSGHGAPDAGTGTAYLVSSDADPQAIRLTGYPMRQLQANLAQLPARSITMVLDACFSGLADRGALLRGISPITLRVENPVLAHPRSVIFTASQATEVSGWYDVQKHGLFTYVFLDAMASAFQNPTQGGGVSARDVAARVGPEVQRLSRRLRQREQQPQLFGSAVDAPLPFVRPE